MRRKLTRERPTDSACERRLMATVALYAEGSNGPNSEETSPARVPHLRDTSVPANGRALPSLNSLATQMKAGVPQAATRLAGADLLAVAQVSDRSSGRLPIFHGCNRFVVEPCPRRSSSGSRLHRHNKVLIAQYGRIPAGCLAHARRKFDELLRDGGKSAVADEALRRIAQIYRLERELAALTAEERLARRQADARPRWERLQAWLRLSEAACLTAARRPRR